MNEKLPVNNINKVKREYPNENNIEGSNKQPDNMLSMLQIFFSDQTILTDKNKKTKMNTHTIDDDLLDMFRGMAVTEDVDKLEEMFLKMKVEH